MLFESCNRAKSAAWLSAIDERASESTRLILKRIWHVEYIIAENHWARVYTGAGTRANAGELVKALTQPVAEEPVDAKVHE